VGRGVQRQQLGRRRRAAGPGRAVGWRGCSCARCSRIIRE
jgi:hypothetical protein